MFRFIGKGMLAESRMLGYADFAGNFYLLVKARPVDLSCRKKIPISCGEILLSSSINLL
jgi:hypothetical protein